jgi:beta propeller repeat protein
MYDMSTGVEIPICTEGDFQGCPAISGDRVVWQDERNDGISNIYMYDMSTGVETQICPHGRIQQSPAIYGDRVVWQDDRNDNSDIYMLELLW